MVGMHKVLPFERYTPPPPSGSQHRIKLWSRPKESKGVDRLLADDLTLQEVYDDYVKPGQMLCPAYTVPKDLTHNIEKMKLEGTPDQYRDYWLAEPYSPPARIDVIRPQYLNERTKSHEHGAVKEVHLSLESPREYYLDMMEKAYRLIEQGSSVEFDTQFSGKRVSKEEKLQPGPSDRWPWVHNYWPHLRPDFILKSMPHGTFYLIKPVSDGRHVQWAMSLPSTLYKPEWPDLTKKLFKKKAAVQLSIKEGMQNELPRAMRAGLFKEGSEDYSLNTTLPRRYVEQRLQEHQDAIDAGDLEQRYMVPTKRDVRKQEFRKRQNRWQRRCQ